MAVHSSIPVGTTPYGVAVTPDGKKVYVANNSTALGTVSVIGAASNQVVGTITVGFSPIGVAVTPDGTRVYVATSSDGTVSVISTATDAMIGSPITVGAFPMAFGGFIQPPPRFSGTLGKSNCYGQSVAALTSRYGGLNAAAAGLGFSSAAALQKAIVTFCGG